MPGFVKLLMNRYWKAGISQPAVICLHIGNMQKPITPGLPFMSGGMHSISSMVIQGLSQLRAASVTLREKAAPVNRQAGEQRLPPGPLSALPRVRTLQHLWRLSRRRSAGGRLRVPSRLRPSFMPVTSCPFG